jgi:cytochrome c peroxidase
MTRRSFVCVVVLWSAGLAIVIGGVGKAEDVGKFKAPTLRNIAVTAPYMHDGSLATLEDVLAHYAAGGRTIASGPHQGVGHDNPNKSPTPVH